MTKSLTKTVSPPLWLLAELTYDCPLHCAYCSNPIEATNKSAELNTEQWCSVLSQAREMGAVQLGFSGGEPLLRKDLEVMVEYAAKLGFYTNLITSGIGLTEKRIANLKEAGLDHIQISFQSADPEVNDAIAGKRKAFEQKLKMAKLVKQYGYPMVLNFVITKQNIEKVADILKLSESLEADYVELAMAQYYGWALYNRDHLLPSEQQIEQAQHYVMSYKAKQQNGHGPNFILVTPDYFSTRPKPCMNGWGSTFLNVAPDGTVLPCHSAKVLPIEFSTVKDQPLKEIWYKHQSFNKFRELDWLAEPCQSCDEKHTDFGGCRCQAYLLTGDMYATDPVCEYSPHRHIIDDAISQAKTPKRELVERNYDAIIDIHYIK